MTPITFCLMGPTASGKTALACELVRQFPVEIISVDSAMIYREMDIGTAKPDGSVLAQAPHHLIDILDPIDSYSAAQFCEDVARLTHLIHAKGKIPLLVGGTMMYFKALQAGLSSLPQADEAVREALVVEAQKRGWNYMHQWLATVDPRSAARIHPNDTQRVQRALEVYQLTGAPMSERMNASNQHDQHYINIALIPDTRAWLHQRIAFRFEEMLENGLIQEVETLLEKWPLTLAHPAMRSVGYRQVASFLRGEYNYSTLCEKGIAATRQLAKRQLTWLRHWPDPYIFTAEDPVTTSKVVAIMKQILDNPP